VRLSDLFFFFFVCVVLQAHRISGLLFCQRTLCISRRDTMICTFTLRSTKSEYHFRNNSSSSVMVSLTLCDWSFRMEYVLPCKVSCGQCQSVIMDEGKHQHTGSDFMIPRSHIWFWFWDGQRTKHGVDHADIDRWNG
jgi:hypothetical protein